MAISHRVKYTVEYLREGSQQVERLIDDNLSAGGESNLSESFTDATDALVAYTLDISQTTAFCIWSVGGDVTVETNNGTTPTDTFTLTDGVPIIWSTNAPTSSTIPLTADITALYVTNTGTAILNVRALVDPTV